MNDKTTNIFILIGFSISFILFMVGGTFYSKIKNTEHIPLSKTKCIEGVQYNIYKEEGIIFYKPIMNRNKDLVKLQPKKC